MFGGPTRVALRLFENRCQIVAVFVLALDGLKGGGVGAHEDAQIPGGCPEHISHQSVDMPDDDHEPLRSSQTTEGLIFRWFFRPFVL